MLIGDGWTRTAPARMPKKWANAGWITLPLAAVLATLALSAGTASAISTVDQHQTAPPTNFNSPTSAYPLAQTFVAGRSGTLDAVSVDVFAKRPNGTSMPDLVVQVRTNNRFGTLTDDVSGEARVPAEVISSLASAPFENVTLNRPAQVSKGEKYALVLAPDNDPLGSEKWSLYFWQISGTGIRTDDPYPGGGIFIGSSSGAAFEPLGSETYDFRFKTFVAPDPSPA